MNGPELRFPPGQFWRMLAFWRLAVVQTPITDAGSDTSVGFRHCPVEFADRDLDGDAVHVHPGRRVDALGHLADPGVGQSEGGVVLLERPQDTEVEDGTEVDVEALGPLAGEDLRPGGDGGDGRVGQADVVGRRQRPDVARRAGDAGAQQVAPGPVDPGDRIGLTAVPARALQRRDRRRVVEEGVRIGDLTGELELIADVRAAVVVVVDVDGIEDVVTELVEVGTAVGGLQGNVVGDQRHGAGLIGAHEGIEIGGVGDGVLGDFRRFTMGRHGYLCSLVDG